MWITIEEMVKSLRGFTKTNFETFSILSLVNQDVTGSTNLTMSSDEKEYIQVFFRENIGVAFKKKFIDHAKKYKSNGINVLLTDVKSIIYHPKCAISAMERSTLPKCKTCMNILHNI